MARGGERGEVRHRRAGHERAAAVPPAGRRSRASTRARPTRAPRPAGRRRVERRVLVPGRRQPVRRQRRRAASRRSRSRRSAGPAMPIVAGEPSSSSSASTSPASVGPSGNGSRSASRRATAAAAGATSRSWIRPGTALRGRPRSRATRSHELPEVTARAAQRTLRSSRIARRRCDAHDRCARPRHDLLDRPRKHERGHGDGILLRALRLDRDRADRERGRLPDAAARRRQVAGLAPVWGDTDGSTWSTYVASADADETCAAAVACGGDVVMDAMDVLTAGRMAVLRDPAGAQVSVWQPGDHQGYEVRGEPGTPIWSELMTRDLASACAFYQVGLRLDGARRGLRRGPVHRVEAQRGTRRRGARDGRDVARGHEPHWMV